MTITTLPSAPLPSDNTATFNSKAFALVASLSTFVDETNAVAVEVESNKSLSDVSKSLAGISETNAAASAANALSYASAAAANTNTPRWVSGTTYALGSLVYSPISGRSYRRSVAGAGTTDPSSDSTNWTALMLEAVTNFPKIRPSLLLDFAATKQLDPRITFTRASTGTFYDDNVAAKAEENLVYYSQDLVNGAWSITGVSVGSNVTTAPDGTSTADSITASAGLSVHAIIQNTASVTGSVRAVSFYVKASTHNFVQVLFGADTTSFANFNITAGAGAVGTVGSASTASIVDAGNGWYRCIINVSTATATNGIFINLISSATASRYENWTAVGTESVYLWGVQCEQRSSVTAYIATTSAPITNYIPVLQTAAPGIPRFDHNPTTGESLGLLIEGQSTNLLTYSEQFDNAAWGKSNVTIGSNFLVAPDGNITADKIQETAVTGFFGISVNPAAAFSTTYTWSCYAKAGERNYLTLNFSVLNINGSFDLTTGTNTVTGGAGKAVSVGNGWWRLSVTVTTPASGTNLLYLVTGVSSVSNINTQYSGVAGNGIYIWGAQLEASAFASSYIPTVASQVTRSADAASMTGTNFSSWYRTDEGTLFARTQVSGYSSSANSDIVSLNLSTNPSNNSINMFIAFAGPNYRSNITAGSVNQLLQNCVYTADMYNDISFCIGYKTNDSVSYATNIVNTADTSVTVPPVDRLTLDGAGIRKYIKRIAYYPKRLSNTELQGVTA
jgi:hypothetical protein